MELKVACFSDLIALNCAWRVVQLCKAYVTDQTVKSDGSTLIDLTMDGKCHATLISNFGAVKCYLRQQKISDSSRTECFTVDDVEDDAKRITRFLCNGYDFVDGNA